MSTLVAHVGQTRNGAASAELWDGDKCVLKAYGNASGDKIRIVLDELRNYGQVLISPDNRLLEFDRQVKK